MPILPDSATVNVEIFDASGHIIGMGTSSLDTTSYYTEFETEINYTGDETPHSYKIVVSNAKNGCSLFTGDCKFLYIDHFRFDGLSSTENEAIHEVIEVYPNPSRGAVYFNNKIATLDIFNIVGELQGSYTNVSSVQLPDAKGIYILKVKTHSGGSLHKKVIRK